MLKYLLNSLFIFLMLSSFSLANNDEAKLQAKLQKEFGHDLTHAPFFLRFAYYKEFDKDWKETDYLERKAFLGDYETQSAAEQAKEEADAKAQIAKEKERLREKREALRKENEQLKAQLTQIQTAINAILLTGASYVRPGFSLTRANLKDLQTREQYLVRSINRDAGGVLAVGEVAGTAYPYPGQDTWNH